MRLSKSFSPGKRDTRGEFRFQISDDLLVWLQMRTDIDGFRFVQTVARARFADGRRSTRTWSAAISHLVGGRLTRFWTGSLSLGGRRAHGWSPSYTRSEAISHRVGGRFTRSFADTHLVGGRHAHAWRAVRTPLEVGSNMLSPSRCGKDSVCQTSVCRTALRLRESAVSSEWDDAY